MFSRDVTAAILLVCTVTASLKNKNRNSAKNLGYDRRLIYNQPRQDLGLYSAANDPLSGPQMILPENDEWHESGFQDFLVFFLISMYLFIYFHQENDQVDQIKEKMY